MPGMMDTILNLGLNDDAVEGLGAKTGNERFAQDSYRRLIQMYGEVVDGIDADRFEKALADLKQRRGAKQDVDLSPDDLKQLVATFKELYEQETGSSFPQDAREQLGRAVRAVFDSWDTPRAQVYRRAHRIPDDLGTAVNVVQMVFGNKGARSGTGVAFTRDPSTGEAGLYGEFLANAQGEDVVAGIRTPQPLQEMKEQLPEAFEQLLRDDAPARGALPGHAGHRVHGRGRPPLPAADPCGEAHRRRGVESRRRDGRRRPDLKGRRGRPDRPSAARPAPAPDAGSERRLRRSPPRD
jgi:pyruvate,orthophosphate dikinase